MNKLIKSNAAGMVKIQRLKCSTFACPPVDYTQIGVEHKVKALSN